MKGRESFELFIKTINRMKSQKWYVKVKLFIKPDFSKEFLALVDFGAKVQPVMGAYNQLNRLEIGSTNWEQTHPS